jgi:hypothetical protein
MKVLNTYLMLWRRKKNMRRLRHGVMPHFKVEMVICCPSASAYGSNSLPLFDTLIALHEIALVMCIDSHDIQRVLHDDKPSVTARSPIAKNHFAIRCRTDKRPSGRGNVNAIVPLPAVLVKVPRDGTVYGPAQCDRCCGMLGDSGLL